MMCVVLNAGPETEPQQSDTHPTCTGSSSTLTWPAISSMSSARWQIDLAWCVHGSGRPLTVMYLSPTVSTCVHKMSINPRSNKKKKPFTTCEPLGFSPVHTKLCVSAEIQSSFSPFDHSVKSK